LIESQIKFEQLNERLEKQLIEKSNLEKQIKTVHSENESTNKKVINFIVFFFFFKNGPKIKNFVFFQKKVFFAEFAH
jgi:hypothetical protein